jgi:hypothetical protein
LSRRDKISAENILPVIANAAKQSLRVWAIASFVAMTGISDIFFASTAKQSRHRRRDLDGFTAFAMTGRPFLIIGDTPD